MSEVKRTPLYDEHIKLNARMVDFAGWSMPVQYEQGLRYEHDSVRNHVGLFDVSHMGEIRVKGENALKTVEHLTSNYVEGLTKGKAQYSLLCNKNGGVVDDLIVYCIEPGTDYLLCVNASNREKDFNWVFENNLGAEISDEGNFWGQIAVQGPNAYELVERIFKNFKSSDLKNFEFLPTTYNSVQCIIAKTGYTGEKGFELFVDKKEAAKLWSELLDKGKDLNVTPVGLGARDTLRTEMKYSLYGHEIDDTTFPHEAALSWVVKAGKKDFIGKEPILEAKEKGYTKKLVGFKLIGRGIARQSYLLFSPDNQEIGVVTSGTMSPTLNEAIGIGFIKPEFAKIGSEFNVQIRGKLVSAVVVETPFVKPS